MSYSAKMQQIVRRYRDEGQPWPATALEIARWAIRNGLWVASQAAIARQCADDVARALREEYTTDPQGRRVRVKHAARTTRNGEQGTFWGDSRTESRQWMSVAFSQRRQGIVGDCRQLKVDVDSFNENRSPNDPIEMVFDFSRDLADIEAGEAA